MPILPCSCTISPSRTIIVSPPPSWPYEHVAVAVLWSCWEVIPSIHRQILKQPSCISLCPRSLRCLVTHLIMLVYLLTLWCLSWTGQRWWSYTYIQRVPRFSRLLGCHSLSQFCILCTMIRSSWIRCQGSLMHYCWLHSPWCGMGHPTVLQHSHLTYKQVTHTIIIRSHHAWPSANSPTAAPPAPWLAPLCYRLWGCIC